MSSESDAVHPSKSFRQLGIRYNCRPHEDLLLLAAEQHLWPPYCSSLKATMARVTTERPARRKATIRTKRVRARLVWKATVPMRKSVMLLASTARVHSREALAPTMAAEP